MSIFQRIVRTEFAYRAIVLLAIADMLINKLFVFIKPSDDLTTGFNVEGARR